MINFAAVTLADLTVEHPERSIWKQALSDYILLYRGGLEFKRAAGTNSDTVAYSTGALDRIFDEMAMRNRRRRFLYQLEGEPDTKYVSRWERAYYIPYIAAIIDYYVNWLFSKQPQVRPKVDADPDAEAPEPPDWFDGFCRDATGSGKSLFDLAKDVFKDVLIVRRAGWLIGQPDAVMGGDSVTLTPYAATEIIDWQEDAAGKLEWIRLSKCDTRRDFPALRRKHRIETYLDRDSWAAWEIVESPNPGDTATPRLLAAGKHDLGEVPFEWMVVPEGLWIANKLAAWQIDLFNQMSMLSYGQLVSCFLQPFIKSQEGSADATNRIMGEGIVLQLRAGSKEDQGEDFGWKSPDVAPLDFNAKRITEMRDEGYRIVHQMSLAVDSKAIGAIARSGVSKIEDRKATEILLCGYGGYVRDFLLRTLDKVSRILGDGTEWVIDGYDNFEVSSLDEELQTAALVATLDIPSPTFNAEIKKQIATGRILGHVDEALKAKICREIDEATEMSQEGPLQLDSVTGRAMAQPPPDVEPPPFDTNTKA